MGILTSIALLLLVLWILGVSLHIAGAFIHIILVIAIALFIGKFLQTNFSR